MATKVSQMTKAEFKSMISNLIEEKMLELIGDPDQKLPIRKSLRARLLQQKKAVAAGERGELFKSLARRLKLA